MAEELEAICEQEIEHENQKIMNIMYTTFHFKESTHIQKQFSFDGNE